MKDSLVFSFHEHGCTILTCKDNQYEVLAELTVADCLLLGMNEKLLRLVAFYRAELHFALTGQSVAVPPAFYQAFEGEEQP